jgi:hypothetical protein
LTERYLGRHFITLPHRKRPAQFEQAFVPIPLCSFEHSNES